MLIRRLRLKQKGPVKLTGPWQSLGYHLVIQKFFQILFLRQALQKV